MIKNIRELSSKQMGEFRKLYEQYFKESLTPEDSYLPECIKKHAENAKCRQYVIWMLRKIRIGDRYALASVEDDTMKVDGFIVGGIDPADASGFISHVYTNAASFIGTRVQFANLYKAFAEFVKSHGASTITAECGREEENLKQALETLGFAPTREHDGTVDYGRSI